MDLTVSIASWNNKDYLRQCLKSIYENTHGIEFEVIVVDNASSDGAPEMVKNNFPQAIILENQRNLGFAKANNQAIKKSGGRYVVVLNQDTILLDNPLVKMVSFLDTNPCIGALGCKIFTDMEKTNIQPSAFKRFPTPGIVLFNTLMNRCSRRFSNSGKSIDRLKDKYSICCEDHGVRQEVAHLVGAMIMLRRQALDDSGLLDERFFMYLEETDLCYRMHKKGWKIYYLPDAEIIHFYDPVRSTKGSQKKIRQESYLKYLYKHHSLSAVIFFKYFYTLLSLKEIFTRSFGMKNIFSEKIK